jgi:hypothetical protein
MVQKHEASLKALHDIRNMMEKSARFISLSGWSGIWAGSVAIAASLIAGSWLQQISIAQDDYSTIALRFVFFAISVFAVAFSGAFYFTWQKTRKQGEKIWNSASKRMMMQIAIPMIAGGIFVLKFLYDQQLNYIASACLIFYGLALINGSKYTLSDIKYLGLLEVALGCISMFLPGYGLMLWAVGFGALHILYGAIVWNKYDKQLTNEEA